MLDCSSIRKMMMLPMTAETSFFLLEKRVSVRVLMTTSVSS
jgi:hypothetical protein